MRPVFWRYTAVSAVMSEFAKRHFRFLCRGDRSTTALESRGSLPRGARMSDICLHRHPRDKKGGISICLPVESRESKVASCKEGMQMNLIAKDTADLCPSAHL